MKVLLTGGNGYIAKSVSSFLKDEHEITSISRKDFDLTDSKSTKNWFDKCDKFDVIIHTAITGGNRLKKEDVDVLDGNLRMYYNLLENKHKFEKFISLGSGAEIYNNETPYGLSKKVIAESIKYHDKFYNLRIFAVFDHNELSTRFIKGNIKRYIHKEPMIIHQDKIMDFFYMEDLVFLINYYIINDNLSKQIDCSYGDQYKLSDIAIIINDLDDYKVIIQIKEDGISPPYFGISNDLLEFVGLKHGIKKTYNKLKNENL